MRYAIAQNRRIERSILHYAKPIGRSMGFYAGRQIPASVVDPRGLRDVYAGVGHKRR
jgi:hypothetical protein